MGKKPHGKQGSIELNPAGQGSTRLGFSRIKLPTDKAEKEHYIVRNFLSKRQADAAAAGTSFELSNAHQNDENDFDFTVTTPHGNAYLELMEAAPLTGPYDTTTWENYLYPFFPYDFAQQIFHKIIQKSDSYSAQSAHDIFLLIYTTHWQFPLDKAVIKCLAYWCSTQPHAFKGIYTFEPDANTSGKIWTVFPWPSFLDRTFNPEILKGLPIYLADMEAFRGQPNGNAGLLIKGFGRPSNTPTPKPLSVAVANAILAQELTSIRGDGVWHPRFHGHIVK